MIEVYGIVENETNEVVYVGQTSRGHKQRFREHKNKKGFDSSKYSILVLKECSVDELEKWEKYYIKKYDTLSKWNKQEGGKNARGYNILPRQQTEEEILWRKQWMTKNNPLNNEESKIKKSKTMSELYSSGKLENPMSKKWLVEYDNGESEFVVSLKKWCREKSYNYMALYKGRQDKDIVKVTKL